MVDGQLGGGKERRQVVVNSLDTILVVKQFVH
jgi:hypothetical protein